MSVVGTIDVNWCLLWRQRKSIFELVFFFFRQHFLHWNHEKWIYNTKIHHKNFKNFLSTMDILNKVVKYGKKGEKYYENKKIYLKWWIFWNFRTPIQLSFLEHLDSRSLVKVMTIWKFSPPNLENTEVVTNISYMNTL